MPVRAYTSISLPNPEKIIALVCDHLVEHDAHIEDDNNGKVVRLRGAAAQIYFDGGKTHIDVSAPTLEGLYFMRLAIVSHIREFVIGEAPAIQWNGDGQDLVRPPNFGVFDVTGVRDISPHMRRVTLSGHDVRRFALLDALHVNLIIPHPDAAGEQWPRIGSDGLILWPNPQLLPSRRKYTVRKVDIEAGTIDIDFVLHENPGPGAAFGARARVGDQIGMIGPGGGGLVEADWYLFMGDETALPAIARMLENVSEHARGKVILEVADAAEIQPLPGRALIDIEWICRDGMPAASGGMLSSAVRNVQFPTDGSTIYAWVGCEYDDFRTIRAYLRYERGLKKHEHLAVSYWRHGREECSVPG